VSHDRARRRRRGRPLTTRQARLRRRRRAVAAAVVAVQVVTWLLTPDWGVRLGVLVLSVFATPVLVTLLFDRRS
jgi:uncharacterized membrane protein